MLHRSALATTVTVVASLATGAVAVAATVRGVGSEVPTRPAAAVSVAPVAEDPPPGVATSGPDPAATSTPADPEVQWLLALSGASAAAAPGAPMPVGAHESEPESRPPTSPSTQAPAMTTSTTAPPFNCSGSDDGMSESYKHAREEYCHAQGDD